MRRSIRSMATVTRRPHAEWLAPFTVLLALLLFGGCGYQDWEASLCNGYRVMTAGASHVILQHNSRSDEVVAINESVAAYGHEEHWIQLRLVGYASSGSIGSGRPIPKPFVLIDAANGTHQRFAGESELLFALPPDVATMEWTQAVSPHTPRYVFVGVAFAVVVVLCLATSVGAAVFLVWKRRRTQH